MSNLQAKALSILSAVFIGSLVFLFLPSEIFLRNVTEFIATPQSLFGNLALGGLLFAALLALPLLVPAPRWWRLYAVLIGGAFLALWVSGVFLLADLGELDGSSFDLARHSGTLRVQSLIFAAALAAGWFAVWKWPRQALQGIAVIGAGLILITGFNIYRAGSQDRRVWEEVSLGEFTRFSTRGNLLIVLMDSFQSDVLREVMAMEPTLRERLDGFRFYPDTLGVAPSTYLTMPALHSGELYNNMMSLLEYYDVGVRDGSFLVGLARNGYRVDLLNPIVGTCPSGASTCTRQENLMLEAGEITRTEASRLADLGFLRAAPGLLKPKVFDGTRGVVTRLRDDVGLAGLELRIYQGKTLLEMIADQLVAVDAPPTARLLHLLNTHPPFMFDQDCRYLGVVDAIDRHHMTLQTACAVRGFTRLLAGLEAAGVYDNTMIILTADTGAGNFYGQDDQSSLYAREHGVPAGELGRLIGGANPVLAIKFPGDRGPLRISDLQAQLTDIPRTVCETLQDCGHSAGLNLASAEPGNRQRIYRYYRWKNEYWDLSRIPGILEYRVEGPLWLADSWSREFSSFMPEEIGTVNFSHDDPAEIFGMGWGRVEVSETGISKRWSIADRAELFLPLPVDGELSLEFEVLTAPAVDNQEMTVRVNGEPVGTRSLDHRVQFVTVTVPQGLVTEPVSKVDLEFSQVQQSEKAGRRSISVSFYQLNIYRAADTEAPG